jgi:hypothetical protein
VTEVAGGGQLERWRRVADGATAVGVAGGGQPAGGGGDWRWPAGAVTGVPRRWGWLSVGSRPVTDVAGCGQLER